MNLMPLANLIENNLLGVKGTNLFINMLPPDAVNAILLRNILGGTKIDYELPKYFKAEFQLIVRGGDYVVTETLINEVIAVLTLNDTQVESIYFNYCRPTTEPNVYPVSKGDLFEFNVIFETSMVET